MKGIAKLAFFVCSSFILTFLLAALFEFLGLWGDSIRIVPFLHDHEKSLGTALGWAVPVALYLSVLLSHTYAARKKVPPLASMLIIILLSGILTFGVFLGIEQFQSIQLSQRLWNTQEDNSATEKANTMGRQAGLILAQRDATVVLLGENGVRGPRVVSFPEQDLLYQGENWGPVNTALAPAVPFGDETPWFMQSLFLDFGLSARELDLRFPRGQDFQAPNPAPAETGEGEDDTQTADTAIRGLSNVLPNRVSLLDYIPFAVYVGGLIILLGSFRIILGMSAWPLANLVLGSLLFRGVLILESFLNTPETQELLLPFAEDRLPVDLVTPFIFAALGITIIVFSSLSYLIWGRKKKNA